MSDLAHEMLKLIEFYHCEMMGHLNILVSGDVELFKLISDKRRQLDVEIRNLLMTKVGQTKNHNP